MLVPLISRERPHFGFDLGTMTAKMVQLERTRHGRRVMGYGYASFPSDAIVEGIIVDPEEIANALRPLLVQMSYGKITAKRVAVSLPVAKVFIRTLQLPMMSDTDLMQAVRLEAEQYVPVPLPDLYLDYERTSSGNGFNILMVAAPRAIVDSYIKLFDLLELQVAHLEPSLMSVGRAVQEASPFNEVTMLADLGTATMDIGIYDHGLHLTDTVPLGGIQLTNQLTAELGLDAKRANELKMKFGLGPSDLQPKIMAALSPLLQQMVSEMRRVLKFYVERAGGAMSPTRLVLTGGTAAMPGLTEYLSQQLGLKVDVAMPWNHIEAKHIQTVSRRDAPMYASALGLAEVEITS